MTPKTSMSVQTYSVHVPPRLVLGIRAGTRVRTFKNQEELKKKLRKLLKAL